MLAWPPRQVRVSIAGGELVAVARFEGYITPTTAGETREKLLAALKRDGVKLADEGAAGGFRVSESCVWVAYEWVLVTAGRRRRGGRLSGGSVKGCEAASEAF